ncbi:MAG: hypothetical protein PHQ66_01665 [Candidatus Nanoarchaeia archaeon]|nr:hypothetical protein [Candidatus Nanoarchaeia archaeon]MDD5357917.1 hypothetical protein [Candidatus Nanoarchaeia archaeon]MDD5588836.1 hypothetical protein [Candidatus Nanoarchaeia archaeon]
MNSKFLLGVVILIIFINFICASSDVSVFQGQYYKGTQFQQGTFTFKFDIYDAETSGNLLGSYTKNISTGYWGQWKTELTGLSSICSDTTKDYFVEISIDGTIQSPRRRLTHFDYLRKDINETTTGSIKVESEIKVPLITNDVPIIIQASKVGIGLQTTPLAFLHIIQETNSTVNIGTMIDAYTYDTVVGSGIILRKARGTLANPQPILAGDTIGYISTRGYGTNGFSLGGIGQGDIRILATENWIGNSQGKKIQFKTTARGSNTMIERMIIDENGINVTGNIYSNNKLVCLADGTNCLSGGNMKIPVRFSSTSDGILIVSTSYLPFSIGGTAKITASPASTIVDKNLTVTGILWNAASIDGTDISKVTLMKSTSSKTSFIDTNAFVNMQGVTKGSVLNFNVNFSQGDLMVLKYSGTGGSQRVTDLSVTVIGYYN